MVDFALAPERTALLNIDMQNLFVEGFQTSAPDGLATLARINQLAAVCRGAGVLVIHVSHVLRPDGSNMGTLATLHPKVRAGLLRKGGTATALHHDLDRDPRDLLLEKPRYGAFHGTDLELILRGRGIDTVIIAGIATNICCDTTAREAAVRDFRVLFLRDGTATSGAVDLAADVVQASTLATIDDAFGQVLSVDEAIRKIRGANSRRARDAAERARLVDTDRQVGLHTPES
jgi:ureidoacrylate peracid hydrolase